METKNKYEYITCEMLEDLGFERILDSRNGTYDMNFEIGYRHPILDARNLILVDYNNGCWNFAQRKFAFNGIGKMKWLDELIAGFKFVTGRNLLE